jgi:hypothetical protein
MPMADDEATYRARLGAVMDARNLTGDVSVGAGLYTVGIGALVGMATAILAK